MRKHHFIIIAVIILSLFTFSAFCLAVWRVIEAVRV